MTQSTQPDPRVLVVEDHPKVADNIRRQLEQEGYQVDVAASGDRGCLQACSGTFDLVVLDLMLPGMDGYDVLAEMRRQGIDIPVLVLTARDALDDRIRGLDAGADDYLVKPFAMPELLARVRVSLRRARRAEHRLRAADVELDLIARVATRNGRVVDLAPREFELLAYLISHAGVVVSREMLGRDVWMQLDRGTPLDNVIDVHIGRLRRKLDSGPGPSLVIKTVRGLGFMVPRDVPP